MNLGVVAIGAMFLFAGLAVGISFLYMSESIWFADVYGDYVVVASVGFAVALVGAAVAVVGVFISPQPPSVPSRPSTFAPSSQASFCRYCGANTKPIDVWCPACGRKLQPE